MARTPISDGSEEAPGAPWWVKPLQQSPALAVIVVMLWLIDKQFTPITESLAKMMLTCTGHPLN